MKGNNLSLPKVYLVLPSFLDIKEVKNERF